MHTSRLNGAVYRAEPDLAAWVREAMPPKAPRPWLRDLVRQEVRRRNYSPRTEKSYIVWMRRFYLFHGKHVLNRGGRAVRSPLDAAASAPRGRYPATETVLAGYLATPRGSVPPRPLSDSNVAPPKSQPFPDTPPKSRGVSVSKVPST